MTKVKTGKQARICQGDIIKEVEFLEYAIEKKGVVEISRIIFPYVVVLTQDCDLNQDYGVRWAKDRPSNQDKKIFSVIVAPLYNFEHFHQGEHLTSLDMTMAEQKDQGKTGSRNLKQNKTPRYHYLEFPDGIPIVPSVVDFKHYFTVNVEYLKQQKQTNFVCQLGTLYREDLVQRFSSFLSRIGLPEERKLN